MKTPEQWADDLFADGVAKVLYPEMIAVVISQAMQQARDEANAEHQALREAVQGVCDFAKQQHNSFKVYLHGINDLLGSALKTQQKA